MLPFEEYSVALICALPIETSAVELLMDQPPQTEVCIQEGNNIYTLGCICGHNVVVTYLPSGGYGTASAAALVTEMLSTFRYIKYGILVGVAGGVPSRKNDLRLGDVAVSTPSGGLGGAFQYDFLKDRPNSSQEHIGALNKPPRVLLSATSTVRKNHLKGHPQTPSYISYMAQVCEKCPRFCSPGVAQDILFEPTYHHNTAEDNCGTCMSKSENIISRPARERSDPYIHYGIIGSGNRVIKDGLTRDSLARNHDILCFEMEAAGLMDYRPCLVIRGISDYADSHRNKSWHPYAALAAAAYAKEVLSVTSLPRKASPVEEKLLEAVLDVLFVCLPEDDRSDLIDVKGKRVPGTCEWFLNDPKYLAWSSKITSEVLVVAGTAGQGKTMLAIHVTEIIEEVATEKQGTLLYFFCSSKDEKHSTGTTILRSLLYQLLKQNPHVLRLFRAHFATPNIQNHTISGITPLWRIFVDLLRNGDLGPVYCVVDGLDECDKVSTQQLLTKISRLRENPVHRLNLLIFCRKGLAWIEDKLGVFPCMDLDSNRSNKTSNDMEKYISYQISQLQFETHLSGDTLTKVGTTLQNGAQGAFLWVSLVSQGLKGKTETEVGDNLQDVPQDLGGIYRQILSQIKDEQQVASIVHWVALSRRPLTIAGLTAATHTVSSGTQRAEDALKIRIQSCGILFKIDGNGVVHLVHQSAKVYLRKHDPLGERSQDYFATDDKHSQLAETCLDLINRAFDPFSRASIPETHPMLDYAILYWPEHSRLGLDSSKDRPDLSISFFRKRSPARDRWWNVYWRVSRRYGEVPTSFTLLHLAAYFGITELARRLLEELTALPFRNLARQRDPYGRTPLFWAASRGHQCVMELLLCHGANVNARDNNKMTPLHLAAKERHTSIIPFLLDRGADMTLTDNRANTPLIMAIKIGSKDVIRVLLRHSTTGLGRLSRILPGLPADWHLDYERTLEEDLLKLQVWFLFGDWEKILHHDLPLAGVLSALLKLRLLSKLMEKAIYTTLRGYEASDGEMVLDLLTNGDPSRLMEQGVHLIKRMLNSYGSERLERLWATLFGPGYKTQQDNQALSEVLVKAASLGVATACRLEERDVVDAMTNIAAKGFYYGYEHGYFEIVRTRCHLFFSELTASLTTQNTSQSIHLISVGINLYVAIQDIGNKQFEEEVSGIWVGTVRELLHGDLKDRAMQSFITSCGDELFYRLRRGETTRISRHMATISTLAEVGGREFANSWAFIIGTVIHESFTVPGIEDNLTLVVED